MIFLISSFLIKDGSLYVDCSLSTSSSNCGTNASPCNNINETFHSSSFAGGEEIIIKSNSTCFGNHNFVCPFPALIRSELVIYLFLFFFPNKNHKFIKFVREIQLQ